MPETGKVKKSFKKFAKKHLANVIVTRRKARKVKNDLKERTEKKRKREEKQQANEDQQHQADLDKLKTSDPEFYSYLESEDPTLLQYGQGDIEAVDENEGSDADTEADEDEVVERKDEEKEKQAHVTEAEVKSLVEKKNLPALTDLFISGLRQLGYTVREADTEKAARKFDDPSLVKATLVRVASTFSANLSILLASSTGSSPTPKKKADGSAEGATSSKPSGPTFKSDRERYIAKRFLTALIVGVQESAKTDAEVGARLLQALNSFVSVAHVIKGSTKALLKVSLQLCTHSVETVRLAAYLVVRSVATRSAGTRSLYQSAAFKGIFLTLIRHVHQYTIHTLPVVAFLMDAVVDLYGTDTEAAYQHAFVYIRQLAIYLRAVLQQQSATNIRTVFNWQFLTALRTWGVVVSTYCDAKQLGMLIYPVVQLGMGLMDLFASPRMYPMHLHTIEMLNHIAARSGTYIPIASYLLRILQSPSMSLAAGHNKKGPATGDEDTMDLQFAMRVRKKQAKSLLYRTNIWLECLFLLLEHLASQSHSIAFPEAFWAVENTLAKLKRDVKIPKVHSLLSVILNHMRATSKAILVKRDAVSFGPCNLEAVKLFEQEQKETKNPLVKFYEAQRAARIKEYAEKQEAIRERERQTLESAVEQNTDQRPGKKIKTGRRVGNSVAAIERVAPSSVCAQKQR